MMYVRVKKSSHFWKDNAMSNLGTTELVLILVVVLVLAGLVIFPYSRIFKKAGFSPALSCLMIVPVVNLATLYFLALAEWPALKEAPPR